MKKNYNQPEIFISEIMPTTIICASITNGGDTSDKQSGGGTLIGD